MVPTPKQDGEELVSTLPRSSQRSIASKMTPGIASVSYRKIISGVGTGSSVPSSILSIIQMKLIPRLSVLDLSGPAARLWSAALDYVSTIPGCSALYWGTSMDGDKETNGGWSQRICLLITWESDLHWARFQDSFGLLLMREVLAEDATNRCIRLASSQPLFSMPPHSLKLASFSFNSQAALQERTSFNEEWMRWRDAKGTGAQGAATYGAWLEHDAVWPTPALAPDRLAVLERAQRELRKAQDEVFVVLIFESGLRGKLPSSGYGAQVGENFKIAGHSAITRDFILAPKHVHFQQDTDYFSLDRPTLFSPPPHIPRSKNLASLLACSPQRWHSENTGMVHNIDQVHETTVKATYSRLQLFPGPRGEMRTKMGDMCQYGPRYSDSVLQIDEAVVDVLELGIMQELLELEADREGSIQKSFLNFRWRVRDLDGCEEMYWGRDDEAGGSCVAIIYWHTPEARTANSQFVQDLTQNFINSIKAPNNWDQQLNSDDGYSNTTGTNTPSSIVTDMVKTSSSIRTRRSVKSPRASYPLLEMLTFEIPDNQHTKNLFKTFYNAFQMTSSLNARVVTQAIPLACNITDYFTSAPFVTAPSASTPPDTPPNEARICITALIGWKSKVAMEEWYADFGAACQGSGYERLGHKIDALRSLGITNMKTRTLAITSDFFGTKRTVMWECGDSDRTEKVDRGRKRKDRGMVAAQRDRRKERESRGSQYSRSS